MSRFADVTGRYVYLTLDGIEYRVYVEEAGSGTPLICQHTAGTDGRQWRHVLEDPDITKDFRVIVPDLPYHGKSVPPEAIEWWTTEYSLTQAFFQDFIIAVAHAFELVDPVYMGCSMGGHLAPDLALNHPDEFRAVIGVQAAMNSHGNNGLMQWYFHPRISNVFKSEHMHTVCAPQSPERYRRETGFLYGQGAPQAFKGDLAYYLVEHDVSSTAHLIDTSKVAVHILSGEYDYSASPADGRALAEAIDGATFTEMKGIGHFPMSENPEVFKRYLMPVLEQILAADAAAPVAH